MTNQGDDLKLDNSGTARDKGVIDWSVLEALQILQPPGKPDLRRKLISIFLASQPPLMERMKEAAKATDVKSLINAAHTLKTSSCSVGAMKFGKTCAEIEKLGRNNAVEEALALMIRAENEFASVCTAFSEALEEKV